MTVRQLLLALQHVDPTAEVRVAYDSGCVYSDAKSVEVCVEAGKRVVYVSTEEDTDA